MYTSKKHVEKLRKNYQDSKESLEDVDETIGYYLKVKKQTKFLTAIVVTLIASTIMDLWIGFLFVMQIPVVVVRYFLIGLLFMIAVFLAIITWGKTKTLIDKIKASQSVKKLIKNKISLKNYVNNLSRKKHVIIRLDDIKDQDNNTKNE